MKNKQVQSQISDEQFSVVELGSKIYKLRVLDFANGEVNIEELLQVDYNNIMGDLITFPVIFNRIANLKAEADAIVRECEFDEKVFQAQLYEEKKSASVKDGEKMTEKALENAILRDPKYIAKKRHTIKMEKQAAMFDGIYWAAKSKTKMLEAISMKIQPGEFEKEILDGVINSVLIKSQRNYFASK